MKRKVLPLIILVSLVVLGVTVSCQFASSLLGMAETPAPATAVLVAPPGTNVPQQPAQATEPSADEGAQPGEPTAPQATEAGPVVIPVSRVIDRRLKCRAISGVEMTPMSSTSLSPRTLT